MPHDPHPHLLVRASLVPGAARPGATVSRLTWLTPYDAQLIRDEALRMGRGTRLDVTVVDPPGRGGLALVAQALAPLVARGIALRLGIAEAQPAVAPR